MPSRRCGRGAPPAKRCLGIGLLALALGMGSLAITPRAAAAATPSRAAQLFDEGLAALDKGQLAQACAKLAESQALEPRVGTLLNLADCEERRGHLVAASEQWGAARELAHKSSDSRETEAKRRHGLLEARIPRLALRLVTEAPPGTTVTRAQADGEAVTVRADGRAERMDPGRYRVIVAAPGRTERAAEIEIAPGETKTLLLYPGPAQAADGSEPRNAGGGDGDLGHVWTGIDTAGAVVGGVGLASLVAGAVLAARASAKRDASNESGHCDASNLCDQEGVDLRAEAIVSARASTATFVVGGVLLAAGVVLVAVPSGGSSDGPTGAPSAATASQAALTLRVSAGGWLLAGRW